MMLPPVYTEGRKGIFMDSNTMSLLETHNIMCRQLKRLDTSSLENLSAECERAKSMTSVMSTIIDNSKTILEAQKLIGEYATAADVQIPDFLSGSKH